MTNATSDWQDVRAAFFRIWGYRDFRPPQDQIIRSLLNAQDALIVLPTGGGKSICFQLPALLQNGLTLVVSPLVALMENQVSELQQRLQRFPKSSRSAALLHSEIPRRQRSLTLQALERQQLQLLYLSPETLLSRPVWERLKQPQVKINGLILDEAHCLVDWGSTFRPAYRRLGAVRPALLQLKPAGTKMAIAAFTATADPTAQQIIQETLQLQSPQRFVASPYRPNLVLQVKIAWTPRCRRHLLLKFVKRQGQQSGLIYVRSRREAEFLAEWCALMHYQTAAYHAGLGAEERRQIEANWLQNRVQFVVCTSAFGMGVNKPDVRWVAHFQPPLLLSEYLQEIGRGGRDGQTAEALTIVSEPTGWLNPEDKQRTQFFTGRLEKQYQQAQKLVRQLPLQGDIESVGRGGDIALALLHSTGQLEWKDPFHYRRRSDVTALLTQLRARQKQLRRQTAQYFTTRQCRWQFLLTAFGLEAPFKCGHCDNCRHN